MSIRRRLGGFTLIELMITVVVVAILAAIALPSYQSYVKKGHRANAKAHLMEIASKQQEYLLNARQYANSVSALGLTTPSEVSQYYTIAVTPDNTGTPPTFAATATPVAGTAMAGDYTFQINGDGSKTPTDQW